METTDSTWLELNARWTDWIQNTSWTDYTSWSFRFGYSFCYFASAMIPLHSSTPRSWLRKPEDMLAMLAISATTFLKVRLVSALWQVTMKLLNSPLSYLGLNFKEQPKESPKSSKIRARTAVSQVSYWLWQWGAHFFSHSAPTENVSIHASEFATSFWSSVKKEYLSFGLTL